MPRCKNKLCREKLPKGTLPQVCSDACRNIVISEAIAKSNAMAERARKRAQNVKAREAKEERRAFRAKRTAFYSNDLTRQKALTQTACNKLCSLLDRGWPCISCGRPLREGRAQNASHYKSRGANSALRYDLRNLHMACVVCNNHMSGNIAGYRDGVLSRYGADMLAYLENAPRLKEWTCEELIELRKVFSAENRHIEAGNAPSKDWRSIEQDSRLSGRAGTQQREGVAA